MNQLERGEYLAQGHTGIGWLQIIVDLDRKLAEIDPDYTIEQVKEKFGGLRYYFDADEQHYEEMLQLVKEAERLCWQTCEACGSTEGVSRSDRGRVGCPLHQ
jgi:hypothetical protein